LTDAEAMETGYPIYRDLSRFQKCGRSQIRNLSAAAQAIIDELQPCHTNNPTSDPMWLFQMLNNIDKHR